MIGMRRRTRAQSSPEHKLAMTVQDIAKLLADGLRPHLPDGLSVSAPQPMILALRRVSSKQPAQGYGSSSPLKYDLRQAGVSEAPDSGTVSAVISILTSLQTDLSEWLGCRWPPFPPAGTSDGAEAACWMEHSPGGSSTDELTIGFRSPSGWSLRIVSLPAARCEHHVVAGDDAAASRRT